MGQNKLQIKYVIMYLDQHKNEHNMNSENSKTSEAQRLRLTLTDKIDLRRGDKHVTLSDLSTCYYA